MKVILEFNLPEDEDAHRFCLNASRYYNAINDLREKLRSLLKYHEMSEEVRNAIESVRRDLHQSLDDNGVSGDFE